MKRQANIMTQTNSYKKFSIPVSYNTTVMIHADDVFRTMDSKIASTIKKNLHLDSIRMEHECYRDKGRYKAYGEKVYKNERIFLYTELKYEEVDSIASSVREIDELYRKITSTIRNTFKSQLDEMKKLIKEEIEQESESE